MLSNKKQKSIGKHFTNGRVFCMVLALLYAGSVDAMHRRNLSSSSSSSFSNSEVLLSNAESKKNVLRLNNEGETLSKKDQCKKLLYLTKADVRNSWSEESCKLTVNGMVFEDKERNEVYKKALEYFHIEMPDDFEAKFNAFMALEPIERAEHMKVGDKDTAFLVKEEQTRVELSEYVKHGHIGSVKELLDKWNSNIAKEIVNLPDNQSGYTPSWIAVKKGNLDMVKLLLEYGADPNVKDAVYEDSLLIEIIENERVESSKKIEIIEKLLEFGADPCITDLGKDSALIVAIDYLKDETTKYEIAKMLLDKAPSVANLTGFRGRTPYMYVNDHEDKRLMELLKGYGANTEIDPEESMSWE